MHYLSHIPENINTSTKCIIMLHGVWSSEEDLFSLRTHFGENICIFSLRWPFALRVGSYAWYPVDFSTGKPVYEKIDVEKWYWEIVNCIEEVSEKYSLPAANIFLMGFSQGAIMSYYTLWKSPEKIGGIIALSGRILDEVDLGSLDRAKYDNKRVFVWHGMMDQVIPYSATERVKQYMNSLGVKGDIHSYPIGHTIWSSEIEDIKGLINL